MTDSNDAHQAAAHTPEPWWIDDDGFIAAGSGDTYCTVADPHCRPTADCGEENDANARRICAAVNTCKGISTEALEQGIIRKLRGALDQLTYWVKCDKSHPDNPLVRERLWSLAEDASGLFLGTNLGTDDNHRGQP